MMNQHFNLKSYTSSPPLSEVGATFLLSSRDPRICINSSMMFKLQEIIGKWFSDFLEKGFKREADKQQQQYDKYKVEYRDGDNT